VLNSSALSALIKLKSLGVDSDVDSIPGLAPTLHISDSNFATIIDAISERRVISFNYLSADLNSENRAIEPYGAGTKNGFWYVAGRDLDRKELRLFRLDRFDSEVKNQGKVAAYEIPSDFTMSQSLANPEESHIAVIRVRRDKAHALRLRAISVMDEEEWSTIEVKYFRESELLSDVLWHGEDAILLSPQSARDSAIRALEMIVKSHG